MYAGSEDAVHRARVRGVRDRSTATERDTLLADCVCMCLSPSDDRDERHARYLSLYVAA